MHMSAAFPPAHFCTAALSVSRFNRKQFPSPEDKQGEEAGEKPYYGFTEGSQFFAVGPLNISA